MAEQRLPMLGSLTTSPILPTRRRSFLAPLRALQGNGFAALHACNTALNMGFTLLQVLVLARILPPARYSEVVFLTAIGFYFQPFNQAVGKANFMALRDEAVQSGRVGGRPEVVAALAIQATVLLVASLAIPAALQSFGSRLWFEDTLFLFLCLAINFWAFDLQSTAWAVDRNLAFVRLSLVHRTLHSCALVIGYATSSLLVFGCLGSIATIFCVSFVATMLFGAGLRASSPNAAWPEFFRTLWLAMLSTLADFIVLNAPYSLVTARVGVG